MGFQSFDVDQRTESFGSLRPHKMTMISVLIVVYFFAAAVALVIMKHLLLRSTNFCKNFVLSQNDIVTTESSQYPVSKRKC